MSTYLILAIGTLILVGEHAAASKNKKNCPEKTTLASFNAAFIPLFLSGVNGTSEIEDRITLLIQQIKNSKVDIFCLQEIFFSDVQRQIVAAVKDEFPYAFSAQNLSMQPIPRLPTMACTEAQLLTYQQCIIQRCSSFRGSVVLCIALSCATEVNSFGSVCRKCLLIHGTTFVLCVSISASQFETNYGLLMLSRIKLKNTKVSPFNPASQFRGYLEASVDGVGDLVCTHLTSILATEFYGGPPVVSPLLYRSYEEQQYAEITTLFPLVFAKDMPILLGDFNHGPASPGNITWEAPFLYGLMNARGFYSPYVLGDGRCTFCTSNPTTAPFPSDILIDHIYLPTNMMERVISSRRILDDVRTSHGTPLSDHYGVMVTLKNTRESCYWWQQKRYYCLHSPRLRFLDLIAPTADLGRLCDVTA